MAPWAGGTGGGCFSDCNFRLFSRCIMTSAVFRFSRRRRARATRARVRFARMGHDSGSEAHPTPPAAKRTGKGAVAPFFDPESSPALDALRRDCLDQLKLNFPLSADARTCAVVLVCGDMRVESADWLALVLAIDRLERDGVLFVKPLETAEDEPPEPGEEPFGSRETLKSKRKQPAVPRTSEPARRRTRLRVAASAPAQALPAAAVMDCLRFEGGPSPRSGATGAVRRRSAVPPADADRAALRAEYVFSPGDELRNALLRKHSSGSDAGGDAGEDEDESEDEDATDAVTAVFDTPVFDAASPDAGAVTTFEGTSRLTRRRRKRPRSVSAAPAPVALRRQTRQRSGSEALRDALAAASISGAMTLHVPVGDVAAALAELDELRAALDRAETKS